ncbi:MAG TPA: hypothetical protein VLI41_03025 [Phenylobacterium sp.]|nr:hypothetical protein [Phenylobacterium sp.]
MSLDPGKAARREAVLQRVQQLLLAVAEDLADAVVSSSDEDNKAKLAKAFHQVTRGLRQTVFLEARLERDQIEAERAARERAKAAEAAEQAARELKIEAAKEAVQRRAMRLVYDEVDPDDGSEETDEELDETFAAIGEWVELASAIDGFAETPVEAHLEKLIGDMKAALGGFPRHPRCTPDEPASQPTGEPPAIANSS